MAHRRVTIGDVAAQAGVSIATVSKVINGRYGVAAATTTVVTTAMIRLFETSRQKLPERSTSV